MEYHNTYVLYVSICTIMLCYVIISCYQLIGTHIYIYIYVIICYILFYVIIFICYYILLYILVFTYGDAQWFLYMGIQRDF